MVQKNYASINGAVGASAFSATPTKNAVNPINNVNATTIRINATIHTPTALTVLLKSKACRTAIVIAASCKITTNGSTKLPITGNTFNTTSSPGAYANPKVLISSPVFDSVSGSGRIRHRSDQPASRRGCDPGGRAVLRAGVPW